MDETKKGISRTKKYFLYLLIILILIDIVDQYSTNYISSFPSLIIAEFLSEYSETEATSILAFCTAIATFGMYFVFLNQYFADKIGRKIMLAINSFGLGISALLLSLSVNIIMYTIFLFLTYIFFSSDMWLIYINEEAPAEKRASWTNLVLATGVVGPIMMPILRSIFISDTLSNWRGMTLLPIILGIPLGFVVLFTIKETSKYEQIKTGLIEKEQAVFMIDNLKAIFSSPRRKEYLMILLMSFTIGLNYAILTLGENYIANYSTITQASINIIIYSIAISVILGYISTGILADKIGRKPLIYFHSVLTPIAVILTYIGVNMSSLPIVAIGFALTYVGFWGVTVILRLLTVEILPTDKRGTGSGMRALIGAIGSTLGLLITGVMVLALDLGVTFIILSIPSLIHIPLIYLYIKETKGTDLAKI